MVKTTVVALPNPNSNTIIDVSVTLNFPNDKYTPPSTYLKNMISDFF